MFIPVQSLTENDKKELWYQCRGGFTISTLLFLISNAIISGICLSEHYTLHNQYVQLAVLLAFVVPLVLGYFFTHDYISDIRNNEKIVELRTVDFTEMVEDCEAGSGKLVGDMKVFMRYNIVVENVLYRVEKDLFDQCKNGSKVKFNIAPLSQYLLGIEPGD
jgi:hypothetical protein